jgi:hypothetical protein
VVLLDRVHDREPGIHCSPDMKKPLRTTKVTIETERVFTFRNYERQQSGWCLECGAETQMATVAHAARQADLNELAIYQLLDGGALHFSEDADGRILVCLNSLLK